MESFSSEEEARQAVTAAWRAIPGLTTVEVALREYEFAMRRKGRRGSSISTTLYRLRNLHDPEVQVAEVTPAKLEKKYAERQKRVAVDTQRNELNEAKTFWRWCVKRGYVRRSPAEGIEPAGRRKRGKKQLRRNELRQLYAEAVRSAQGGDEAAVAVLVALLLGCRASEILERRVRDVDVDDGAGPMLLWIDRGKSEAAERHHEVPEPLAGLLAERTAGRDPAAWLFPSYSSSGHRGENWLLDAGRRLCKAAGVPRVTTHGLRGTWATLTSEAGTQGHVVARELGHASQEVTRRHYIEPGAEARARTRKLLKVIEGGAR